jgi:hypothetical protein
MTATPISGDRGVRVATSRARQQLRGEDLPCDGLRGYRCVTGIEPIQERDRERQREDRADRDQNLEHGRERTVPARAERQHDREHGRDGEERGDGTELGHGVSR